MGAAVVLGYEYKVIGRIALTDDGTLVLSGDTKTLEWWITRLQGTRSNEEFVRTLPRRLNSLLWARQVQEEKVPIIDIDIDADPRNRNWLRHLQRRIRP